VADKSVIASITASASKIYSMSYSSSLSIVVTSDNTVVRVWRTGPDQVATEICQALRTPVSATAWKRYVSEYPYTPVCP